MLFGVVVYVAAYWLFGGRELRMMLKEGGAGIGGGS